MGVTVFQVHVWCEEGLGFSPLGETGEGLSGGSPTKIFAGLLQTVFKSSLRPVTARKRGPYSPACPCLADVEQLSVGFFPKR
jgi:hypothetical protein